MEQDVPRCLDAAGRNVDAGAMFLGGSGRQGALSWVVWACIEVSVNCRSSINDLEVSVIS
jgi:hypothetical protein